ncbi:MAG: MgtC/SapB family protein [Chloroflexi bacterium]|jgi:putative Mg2+ transporter-C (MgtC) family protein|nr:MgtC/SapB family protein [Chloroflexota bacterium]
MVAELDMILRLLLSAVLGAVIGYQREKAGKQAGLRTNTLICVGGGHGHNISSFAHTAFDK